MIVQLYYYGEKAAIKRKRRKRFIPRLVLMLAICAITLIGLKIAIYTFVSSGDARYVLYHRRIVDLTASGENPSDVSAADAAAPMQPDSKDSLSDLFDDISDISSIMMRGGKIIHLEAGSVLSSVTLSSVTGMDVVPVTPLSAVRTDDIGYYKTEMLFRGLPAPCLLIITDTTAPMYASEGKRLWLGEAVPKPEELISDLHDNTQTKCRYAKAPDCTQAGTENISIEIADRGGNISLCSFPCEIVADTEPPVIHGAADKTVFIGSDVMYKSGVTADDNRDGAGIPVNVDISAVNPGKAGVYPVTYSAVDSSGLSSSVTVNFTFEFTKEDEMKNKVSELIAPILGSIVNDGMSDREKANAIYNWVRYNIKYVGSSEKSTWYQGAYDGMTHRSGDCYTYFSVSKTSRSQESTPPSVRTATITGTW